MATKVLRSIKGRRFRITREDVCGAHIVGSCSSVVSDGFVSITLTGEYEAGEDFSQKNAWGTFTVAEKDDDAIKWVNVIMQFAEVDPNVVDIIGGASINTVVTGTDTVGFTHGTAQNGAGFGIEVWTGLAAQSCIGGSPEWGYFVVPFVRNGRVDGDIPAGRLATFGARGEGRAAPSTWATTPYTDNPLLRTGGFPTGDIYGVVRTTVQPPAVTTGCVALA